MAQSSKDIMATIKIMARIESALARPQLACSNEDQIDTDSTEVEAVKIRIVAEISRRTP